MSETTNPENYILSHEILKVRTYSQLSHTYEKIKSLVLEYSTTLINFEYYNDAQGSKARLIDAIIEVVAEIDDYWNKVCDPESDKIVDEELHALDHDLNVITNPLGIDRKRGIKRQWMCLI